jgi:hypothetical protein
LAFRFRFSTFNGKDRSVSRYDSYAYSDKAGADQNRGQFVSMVAHALNAIPRELWGEATIDFLNHKAGNPYSNR